MQGICCVYICVCARMYALIYSYTYTCVSCINEPEGTAVWDERNGWFSIDIGRRSTTTRIRKLEYLYFCLAFLPYRFIFIPSIFILPDFSLFLPHIPARANSIRVLSSHNILTSETSHASFSPARLSSRRTPTAFARTERLLQLAEVYNL